MNVHQRPLGQICPAGGSVPQGQQSSAGSVGSAPSPASPRPTPQPRPPVASTASQPSRTLDDDRSTDGELERLPRRSKLYDTIVETVSRKKKNIIWNRKISVNPDKCPLSNWLIAVGTGTAAEDSDDGESIAQYVSTNCVVFTHYRGDAASEVEEHFQRALAHDKPKGELSKLISFVYAKCRDFQRKKIFYTRKKKRKKERRKKKSVHSYRERKESGDGLEMERKPAISVG